MGVMSTLGRPQAVGPGEVARPFGNLRRFPPSRHAKRQTIDAVDARLRNDLFASSRETEQVVARDRQKEAGEPGGAYLGNWGTIANEEAVFVTTNALPLCRILLVKLSELFVKFPVPLP